MEPLDQKSLRESDEDMISNLADSILHHILSFVSTKDVIRTSILSKRWRNVWTLVPCLDLDAHLFHHKHGFGNFIERFLNLHGKTYLQKFVVSNLSLYGCYFLRSWMDAGALCKVEHLDVALKRSPRYGDPIPRSFFMSNSLVVLKLRCADLNIPDLVSLSSLKVMHLDEVKFKYEDVSSFKRLTSGCPVLEDLRIIRQRPDGIKVLSICCERLKQLHIEVGRFCRGEGCVIVIDAPYLEYLHLSDHISQSIVIKNVGLRLKAYIQVNFNLQYGYHYVETELNSKRETISRFLSGIASVRSLNITVSTLELISRYGGLESLPQFNDLTRLETSFYKVGWELLPALLECCPNLKTFIWTPHIPPKSNPLRQFSPPRCLLSSLESMTVREMIGEAEDMDVIWYFLEHSRVLKQMKVYMSQCLLNLGQNKVSIVQRELLTFPRASTACRISIN